MEERGEEQGEAEEKEQVVREARRSDQRLHPFLPHVTWGRLAVRWRKVLEEMRASSGGLVRGYVAEQSGVPLGSLLYSSQPGEVDSCGQVDCNPCRRGTSRKLSCRRVAKGGQVYSCSCLTCEEGGQCEAWYHGETSRNLYSCQREHLTGLAKSKMDNALYKHQEVHHRGQAADFQF